MAGEEIAFSLWPVGRTNRRYGVQHRLFAADPWPLIASAIDEHCPKDRRKPALAFCAQGEDFYVTATQGRVLHAKPLLLYYAMLNLAKAFILTMGYGTKDYRPQHGLSENASPGQIATAAIRCSTNARRPQLFSDFLHAISRRTLSGDRTYRLGEILPQLLPGHRVWCAAAHSKERFVGLHEIRFLTRPAEKSVWVQALLRKSDVARLGISYSQLLKGTLLSSDWRIAQIEREPDVICIEKVVPDSYDHRPSDSLMKVVDGIRQALWSSVLIVPPYVKYYLYVAPPHGRASVLPQLLSMYLVMFFLGSITRYRPHHFERLIESGYGAQIEGTLNDLPSQFLFLLASEFLKRDVSKAAIV